MNHPQTIVIITAILTGVCLSAAAGFKVFTPFLLVSILAKYGILDLADNFMWLSSNTAIIVFATATVTEIICSFIPAVDNATDSIAIPLSVAAGTILTVSLLEAMDPAVKWALAIIAGGATSGIIKTGISALRLGSTATTFGVGNSLIAAAELAGSVILTVLAVLAVPVCFILVIIIVFFAIKFLAKAIQYVKRRKKTA